MNRAARPPDKRVNTGYAEDGPVSQGVYNLAGLRPNPDWASLPLFDRSGWTRLPFGDFAQSVNERVEPADAAEAKYVGLEHIDPQNLHIRRWGKGSDVIGTKLRFRKGDIIFGRRRAYQRKLAVAEFDGICSAHAMVVRAKPDLVLPEFLPFLMMSDRFMKRAVEISVGSLSPTINWKTLKQEEFDLPPLEVQRRIAEVLRTLDKVQESYLNAICRSNQWISSFVEGLCYDQQIPRVALSEVIDAIIPGKSVSGVNEPIEDGQYGVLKVSAAGPNGFDAKEQKRLTQQNDFLPQFAVSAGDFLITRCNTPQLVGRVCIVPDDHPDLMLCDKTIKLVFSPKKVEPRYLEEVLRSREVRQQIERRASGTGGAMKNISQDDIRSLVVPLPELERQKELIQTVEMVKENRNRFEIAIQRLSSLLIGITDQALGQ